MSDTFGSPQAHDATAEWDKMVEDMSQEYRNTVKGVADNLMNRQLGSKKVPQNEVLEEWKLAKASGSVQWMAQQLVDEGNDSLEKLVRAAFDREHKLRG